MKPQHKIVGALVALVLLSLAWVPEAHAFRGRGAAFVVGAAVGSSKAEGAEAEAAAAQQQAAASQQQAAAAQQQAATAQQQLAAEKEKTAAAQKEAEAAKKAAAAGPAPAVGRTRAAAGHRRGRPSGGMHGHPGGRRELLLLRRQLLPGRVRGQQHQVRHDEAEVRPSRTRRAG